MQVPAVVRPFAGRRGPYSSCGREQGAPWRPAARSTGEFSNRTSGDNYSGINSPFFKHLWRPGSLGSSSVFTISLDADCLVARRAAALIDARTNCEHKLQLKAVCLSDQQCRINLANRIPAPPPAIFSSASIIVPCRSGVSVCAISRRAAPPRTMQQTRRKRRG
jgi:hypothetical protein